MNKEVFSSHRRFEDVLPEHYVEEVDNIFDCLNLIYQVTLNVTVKKNGTFCFLIQGINNFEVVRDFFDRHFMSYCCQTRIVGVYEVFIHIPYVLKRLNSSVNRGMREPAADDESAV